MGGCAATPGIALLQISLDMPQLQKLQKAEALRQAVSQSTSCVLRISQLRHVRTDLQYVYNSPV